MTKQQSSILKGVAILMMLWYHLFQRDDMSQLCTSLITINEVPLAHIISRACYPVTFFMILSGYGLSYLYQQGKLHAKDQFRRLLRLYIHYWVILLIFVSIGVFVNPDRYIIDPLHLAANITGLHCTYNGETWFLLPYAINCLLAVWYMPTLFRIHTWRQALPLLIGYALCFGGMKVLMMKYGDALDNTTIKIFIFQIVYLITNFFYFALGVLLFRLYQHYGETTFARKNIWIVAAALLILIAVKSCFKVTLLDGVYAFLFILLFLHLPLHHSISNALTKLGQHSMPMWMTHTFFAVYLFQDFIYSFRYPLLIFVALVTVCYLVSFPVLWISKRIIKLCRI